MNKVENFPKKSVWGFNPSKEEPKDVKKFSDIMSEQFCNSLDIDELCVNNPEIINSESSLSIDEFEDEQSMNDKLIAKLLQQDFDLEHDEKLNQSENFLNKNSTTKVSFKDKKRLSASEYFELTKSELMRREETYVDLDDELDYYKDENGCVVKITHSNQNEHTNSRGIYMSGDEVKTKHDLTVSGHKNALRIINNTSSDFLTGDLVGLQNRSFNNRVYNDLKLAERRLTKSRSARTAERKGDDFQTVDLALDEKTRKIIFKLVQQDRLMQVDGILSTGKEAVILSAQGGDGCTNNGLKFPEFCAIKVYKTTLNEFRNRRLYVKSDYRFKKNDLMKRQNPRKVIKIWAKKEALNLNRIHSSGIPCPKPIFVKNNVLVMQFVGEYNNDTSGFSTCPAPTLKECAVNSKIKGREILSSDDWEKAYHQCCQILKDLYSKCNIVHADFSEYNLLWHQNNVWVIDVGQSVDINQHLSWDFLRRDCFNITRFFREVFRSDSTVQIMPYEDLFNLISQSQIKGYDQEFLNNFNLFVGLNRIKGSDISKKFRENYVAQENHQFDADAPDYYSKLLMFEEDDNCSSDSDSLEELE